MDIKKVRWACRRGMLELDVILRPFVDGHYESLTEFEKVVFVDLLTADDPELFAWFMGHEECKNEHFVKMINKIHKLNGAVL
ncbi:succinate dehydrogenase assembly factor 2 [Algibacillus agarilyticus]|uniref:FAD assembly factor SdhE n=1 Tax=Algibacillus agarilyticus TaxID=2234133 RepID=UPI000DCF9FF5|nr:succinate dehydrogenase assembly factor 2 [Algibacillus agarilyticus]